MWQAETFDPVKIDQEIGLGQNLGMNTMRIFLHDLVYAQDPTGFKNRVTTVLQIADKYGIKPILVFFTTGAIANPSTKFAASPSLATLITPSAWSSLQTYLTDIVGTFANDARVLAWDIWNEPDNGLDANAVQNVIQLLSQAFAWARSANPTQPLTSSVYKDDYTSGNFGTLEQLQINNSDVVSFKSVTDNNGTFLQLITALQKFNRPIIATEVVHRNLIPSNGAGSTINILPIVKSNNVGIIYGGFVNGATRRNFPPDSWQNPYVGIPPSVWYHDLFRNDLTPYLLEEIRNIKHFNDCPFGYQSKVDNFTCYNTYPTPVNFTNGQAACMNTYSTLVTINSAFENSDLRNYISSSNYSNCDRFYIGLYKGEDWLSWQWQLRGKNVPYVNPTYRNWKNGYPINSPTFNCVVLNKADGTWTNQPCYNTDCYICGY
uniref:C-type lectin domain-containing protein n=1 Tax=Acrobeloides nanus TaxID=290746 RepID=A0A914CPH3_9BILA